jgi:seryl-tRNA synthetase
MIINEKIIQMENEINALKKLEKEISERIDNLELKLLRLKAESIPEEEFDEDYNEIMEDIDKSLKKGDTIPAEKLLKDLGL